IMQKFLTHLGTFVLGFLLFSFGWSLFGQTQQLQPSPNPTSTTTTLATEEIYSVTNVWLTFGLNRIPALQKAPFFGIPLWQFAASLLYVFLAFYFSRLLDNFIVNRVKKWAERTATTMDDLFINLVRGPIRVVSFVILLHIGIRVYVWPA